MLHRSKSFSTLDQLKKDLQKNNETISTPSPITPTPIQVSHEYQLASYVVQIFDRNNDCLQLPIPLNQFYSTQTLFGHSIHYIVLSCPYESVLPFFTIEHAKSPNITLTNTLENEQVELTTDLLLDGCNQQINQFDLYLKVLDDIQPGDYKLSFKPMDSSGNLLENILTINITIHPNIYKPIFTNKSTSIEDVIASNVHHLNEEDLHGSLIPTCAICYNPLCSPNEPIITLQSINSLRGITKKNTCGHTFHSKCIDVWKKTSETYQQTTKCPECRSISIPLVINL